MLKSNKEKYSFLSNFLISKKFRVWRHVLLIIAITIIAVNGTFGTFGESYPIIGNKIYWIVLFSLILDLTVIYFNLYILVAKLLLKGKYLQYTVALSILVSAFIGINFGCEYYIFKHENISCSESSIFYSGTNFVAEYLYSLVIYSALIISVSMTELFKNWRINLQRVGQLETAERRSQLENMKEKISPFFLSRMLKKSASLATSAPQETSDILLKLSKILRYQLYDCSRDKVLLSSEIEFLANYLNLEKKYYENFDFSISKEGDTTSVFIPPLLFLPFVQKCMMQKTNDGLILKLHFSVKDNQLQFRCIDNGIDTINYSDINHRLELLYNDQHSITIKEKRELSIQINI